MDVLLVKMSSLGDVVHALPAVTDAAAHGARFHWLVEEAFADIPARHPGVDRVLPIAWRRWRRSLTANREPLGRFLRELRAERYDLILDAQGLIKSAAVSRIARASVRAGFSFTAARERVAALAYGKRLPIARNQHAVDRLRALFAAGIGYPLPATDADFGLAGAGPDRPQRCLLLHGTTWQSKHWPLTMWQALAAELAQAGWQVEVPWGSEEEQARARAIADAAPAARVLESLTLGRLADRMAGAGLVVGVDSGLSHLAGALGVPTVVLYGSTSTRRTGVRGERVSSLSSSLPCAPCLNRQCRYRGQPVTWRGEPVSPPCYAALPPERVREEAEMLLERHP